MSRAGFLEMSVADRVRYVRRNLAGRAEDGGMTQPELAAAVGIPSSRHHTVIRWEKGASEPKPLQGRARGAQDEPGDQGWGTAGVVELP
jgi:DNA-binding XRE family transcriptional regulator